MLHSRLKVAVTNKEGYNVFQIRLSEHILNTNAALFVPTEIRTGNIEINNIAWTSSMGIKDGQILWFYHKGVLSFWKALLILHKKFFAIFDKTMIVRGLKLSLCLNQRETICSVEEQDLVLWDCFQIQIIRLVFYCTISAATSDRPYYFICAWAFAKVAD